MAYMRYEHERNDGRMDLHIGESTALQTHGFVHGLIGWQKLIWIVEPQRNQIVGRQIGNSLKCFISYFGILTFGQTNCLRSISPLMISSCVLTSKHALVPKQHFFSIDSSTQCSITAWAFSVIFQGKYRNIMATQSTYSGLRCKSGLGVSKMR